jgi:hypothetical protein
MSWDSNPYSSPEKFGLRTIGEAEFSDGCYQFDTTVVWQDIETGAFYYADDSGCSCPSPFEGEDRTTITQIERLQDLIDHLEKRKTESYRYTSEWDTSAKAEIDGECASLVQAYREARR